MRVFASVSVLFVGFYLGWVFITSPRGPDSFGFLVWIATLPAALALSKAVDLASSAPGHGIARRVVGIVCNAVLFSLLCFVLIVVIYEPLHLFGLRGWPLYIAVTAVVMPAFYYLSPRIREYAGRAAKPVTEAIRATQIGKGGSSAFGGLLEEWRARYKPGAILMGSSFYDPSWRVGHDDDRGLMTIASSRSGKGRSAIIPNLLTWPGSALVIDPKGTNAAVTAARRGHGGGRVTEFLGQEVHIIDPFGIVPGARSASFNPLSSISIDSARVTEDIGLIADALVVPGSNDDSHWDESARTIIAGLIAHLLASGKGSTLLDVRNALQQDAEGLDSLFGAMLADKSAGALASTAASLIQNAGGNERGSFFTTVMRNIRWLDSVTMQRALSHSDFNIGDLKFRPMTVYVVLPPDLLEEHKRFMRLFVNLAIRGMSQGGKGTIPVLFLLDEFYSLGKIKLLEKAAGLLAGYGMKLWPIVQNLTQLQHLYPQNWEGFLANAGVVQVFSCNDKATMDYLVARLGRHAYTERTGQQVTRVISDLRESEEFGRDLGREKLRQIIMRSGDDPLVLRRIEYDKAFPTKWFNIDPDFAASPVTPTALPPITPASILPPPQIKTNGTLPKKILDHLKLSDSQAAHLEAGKNIVKAVKEPQKSKKKFADIKPEISYDPFVKLNNLVGLMSVKKKAREVVDQVTILRAREDAGLRVPDISFHLVFTGNPGTGKTTVARIMGQLYKKKGVLKKGHLIEVTRANLVGEHVGKTAPLVMEVIEKAMDGVLFIDEAYSLVDPNWKSDFGHEAVAILLKAMEDHRGRLMVIAAGYTKEMEEFIGTNPGLKSRFKTFIEFPDYNADELEQIFAGMCEEYEIRLSEEAEELVADALVSMTQKKGRDFGNGRDVRNFFEQCLERQATRLVGEQRRDIISLSEFTAKDIPPAHGSM